MPGDPMTNELTRLPLDLSAAWQSKTVTTDPPRLTPHDEWALTVRLAAKSPFRVAVMLDLPSRVHWGLRPDEPSEVAEIRLNFFPHGWSTSDRVQINFGWQRVTVTDPELKADPRPHADVTLPANAKTGEVIPICEVRKHGITLAVLALAQQDTEARRQDRWRLHPQLAEALPSDLAVLATGRQHGVSKRPSRDAPGIGIPT
jgi:hypothetical protein